ncbi:hypothetical protein, partial [Agromyces humi]|uniref:hypothetical protein n=1 Tax=Agromyces humi TaxID=1766800 RepID=UPI00193A07BD
MSSSRESASLSRRSLLALGGAAGAAGIASTVLAAPPAWASAPPGNAVPGVRADHGRASEELRALEAATSVTIGVVALPVGRVREDGLRAAMSPRSAPPNSAR